MDGEYVCFAYLSGEIDEVVVELAILNEKEIESHGGEKKGVMKRKETIGNGGR